MPGFRRNGSRSRKPDSGRRDHFPTSSLRNSLGPQVEEAQRLNRIASEKVDQQTMSVGYLFYLPRGTLTSSELISIHIFLKDPDPLAKLLIKVGDAVHEVQNSTVSDSQIIWDADNFVQFGDSSVSSFEIIFNDQVIPVSFDSLSLFSPDDALSSAPEGILLFRFFAGFFARSCDFQMGTITLPPIRVLSPTRREAFEKACRQHEQLLSEFREAFDSKFSELYQQNNAMNEARRRSCTEKYEEYAHVALQSPRMSESYCFDGSPERSNSHSHIKELMSRASRSPSVKTLVKSLNSVCSIQQPTEVSAFPRLRDGWKSPSTPEIRMCLEELAVIFPVDEGKGMFCNISETDPDVNAQKMFLFDVTHFMTLFAQFTGIIFDYRITLVSGWYRFEERMTGNEVKRELHAKNIMGNPYRSAIFSCLKKIVGEFHLQVTKQTMVSHISAIMSFAQMLVDTD